MSVIYSIESALPYAECSESRLKIFSDVFDRIVQRFSANETFIRTLLVDDITSGLTQEDDLSSYTLASSGNDKNTLVMRESMLNDLADKVYSDLAHTLPVDELMKLKSKDGYSSPFYIAVWTLVKLGYVRHPDFPAKSIAKKIINILPASFKDGEEVSLEIIRQTRFSDAANQVYYEYIEESPN